ncbi:MAG: hypothetical protein HYZ15_15690 [Sphingobacteriales bacterium]|nr:hypothetical protein [Sphingobacteriales bacterium]
METEIFTLCDFAQDNHSKLTIVGTFDSMQAAQFPVQHPSCSVACRLRFAAKESGDHDFRLRLIDSGGKEIIQPIQGNISIGEPANGQFSSVNIVINFNQLKFDTPGRYSFELSIDGQWISGLPLFLTKQP